MRDLAAEAGPREPRLKREASSRARRVRMVVLDVDGVLTDGKIIFAGSAEEAKHFSAQDGVGIRLAQRAGIGFGIISGRESDALLRHARELGITGLHLKSLYKAEPYARLRKAAGLGDEEIAYIGDDLLDMPIFRRVGFAATVPEARPEVVRAAHFVTSRSGGDGAVREILDFILRVQGLWHRATRGFL